MKKILYTITFLLATGTIANAQTPVLQSQQEMADFIVLENQLLIFTRKQADGQYIYSERLQQDGSKVMQKETVLNAGTLNTVIGKNEAGTEVYVYQKNGRKQEVISFYRLKEGNFEKTDERRLPKLKNNSANLGLYLSPDKNTLLIAAELGKTRGYDDLYASQWENNRWTRPQNLGPQVNTRQVEFAPFVADNTLYFARQEGEQSMIYSAPFEGKAVSGEAVKMDKTVNSSETYNAYYKKLENGEYRISASADNTYAIYRIEEDNLLAFAEDPLSFADAVSGSQDPGTLRADTTAEEEDELSGFVAHSQSPDDAYLLDSEEAAKNHMVTHQANGLTMHYTLNQVYMGNKQAQLLNTYLKALPNGATLTIKGFSDGFGSEAAKARVSRQRAQLLKAYIQQNFAAKNLNITVDTVVREEVGKHFRIAEIRTVE